MSDRGEDEREKTTRERKQDDEWESMEVR